MKFGFSHHICENLNKHIHLAKVGEELGFDFFWLPDQTFFPDPYILLGLVAQTTKQIQIGLAVTNPHTRHPAISARSIGTMAQIAPGRVHFAVGAGNNKELLIPLGMDGAHSGTKIREMIEIVRALLSGEKIYYHGKFFQADGVQLDFAPPGPVSLYMAGRGPYVLQSAGEIADGVIIGALCNRNGISYAIDQIKLGATRFGRDISNIRIISWLTVILTDDYKAAYHSIRRSVAHIIGGATDDVLKNVGLDMDLISQIKKTYWHEGVDQAGQHVTEDCINAFALVGNPKDIISRIQMLTEAGVNQLSINLGDGSVEYHQARIQEFAQEIFPAF